MTESSVGKPSIRRSAGAEAAGVAPVWGSSDLERARIGRSGVGLGRVVSDLLEREGREFGGEFT